jgi:hypothetical protein
MQIPERLVTFVEGPVWCQAGTRDRDNVPASHLVYGVKVSEDRSHLTAILAEHWCAGLRENLADNGRFVLVCTRQATHETYQVKGTAAEVRAATAADHAVQDRWLADFVAALKASEAVEYADALKMLKLRPCVAVTMRIDDAFVQTPGPGAGERMTS